MKKFTFMIVIYLILITMFLFPQTTFSGAKSGVLLWLYTVLPTLFPFIVMSNLLLYTNAFSQICSATSPLLSRLFKVSKAGTFAIICGFLCGYPMGAKIIADLVKSKKISQNEGQYLLSFCNNASPMFIISYVVLQNIGDKQLVIPTLMLLLTTPLFCSFIFRRFHRYHEKNTFPLKKDISFHIHMFEQSIMDAFSTVIRVGGYIIFFSVIITIAGKLNLHSALLSSIEITTGISVLSQTFYSYYDSYIPILALTSFGGICSIMQTQSMIQGSGLKIVPYIIEKLITAIVTSLFAYLFVYLG